MHVFELGWNLEEPSQTRGEHVNSRKNEALSDQDLNQGPSCSANSAINQALKGTDLGGQIGKTSGF